tara:strand:+ start:201 stop:401 length:201 start_codon:yes stop_codon:yes gene_type:complete
LIFNFKGVSKGPPFYKRVIMANIVLYSEDGEEKSVIQNTKEWHDLLKIGWTSWKKPSPKKTAKKKA